MVIILFLHCCLGWFCLLAILSRTKYHYGNNSSSTKKMTVAMMSFNQWWKKKCWKWNLLKVGMSQISQTHQNSHESAVFLILQTCSWWRRRVEVWNSQSGSCLQMWAHKWCCSSGLDPELDSTGRSEWWWFHCTRPGWWQGRGALEDPGGHRENTQRPAAEGPGGDRNIFHWDPLVLRVKGAVLDTFGPQYVNGNGPFVIRTSFYATFDIF